MHGKIRSALLVILAAAGASWAFYGIGDDVQDFTLLSPAGDPMSLSDFQGDVILLNFFATW